MDAHEKLDRYCKRIENDDSLTDEEKDEAIRAEEEAFGDHQAQYEAEQENLRSQYGF